MGVQVARTATAIPDQGVSVSLTGPNSYLATTNDLGCAVFPFIDVGDYNISPATELVGWQGESPGARHRQLNSGPDHHRRAGDGRRRRRINAIFDTKVGNGTTVSRPESRWITVGNAKLTRPIRSRRR